MTENGANSEVARLRLCERTFAWLSDLIAQEFRSNHILFGVRTTGIPDCFQHIPIFRSALRASRLSTTSSRAAVALEGHVSASGHATWERRGYDVQSFLRSLPEAVFGMASMIST